MDRHSPWRPGGTNDYVMRVYRYWVAMRDGWEAVTAAISEAAAYADDWRQEFVLTEDDRRKLGLS